MKILVIREKDKEGKPAEILDTRIIPSGEVERYSKRAAELNKTNARRNYSIEEYDDGSLVAFLATDRQYDMSKYSDLAAIIRADIAVLEDKLFTLGIFYREAAEASGSHEEPAVAEPLTESRQTIADQSEVREQSGEPEPIADNRPQFVGVPEEIHAAVVARKRYPNWYRRK